MKPYERNTMKIKSAMSSFGNGLLTATTVLHNAPIHTRIAELDMEIEKLQEEKTKLEDQLIR
jgi:uncharacterized small protein (DUF1192 family)